MTSLSPEPAAAAQPRAAAGTLSATLTLSLFAVLLTACYLPVLLQTGRTVIFSDDMAYGFFAPLVALFIAWDRRGALLNPQNPSSNWSLAFIFIAALMGLTATLANSSTLSRTALLISLAGCLLLLGGWQALYNFSFPLFLLLFTFPIPDVLYGEITQPLQLLATKLSEGALELLGFSVMREGNILQLVHMRLSVVEACSGLRSLVTLSFFCLVYGFFFEPRMWLRALTVFLAIPSAIAVNVLRITSTGVLGKYNMEWTEGTYHEIVGWVAFSLGFLIVFGTHRSLVWFLRSRNGAAA